MAMSTRVARGSGRSGSAIAFTRSCWWCTTTSIWRDARRTVVLLKGCNPSRESRSARSGPSSSSAHSAYAACISCSSAKVDGQREIKFRKEASKTERKARGLWTYFLGRRAADCCLPHGLHHDCRLHEDGRAHAKREGGEERHREGSKVEVGCGTRARRVAVDQVRCCGTERAQTCLASRGSPKRRRRRRRPRVRRSGGTGKGSISTNPAGGRPSAWAANATWCAKKEPKEMPIST